MPSVSRQIGSPVPRMLDGRSNKSYLEIAGPALRRGSRRPSKQCAQVRKAQLAETSDDQVRLGPRAKLVKGETRADPNAFHSRAFRGLDADIRVFKGHRGSRLGA